jgi:hypothetical protein
LIGEEVGKRRSIEEVGSMYQDTPNNTEFKSSTSSVSVTVFLCANIVCRGQYKANSKKISTHESKVAPAM